MSGTGIGVQVLDVNGDGRHDILRWQDDSTKNTLYLSNGDGTFTASSSFNLGLTTSVQLRKSDGTFNYVLGDFTGQGTYQILRTATAPAAGDATSNILLTKADSTPPDLLSAVKSSSAVVTTLYYVPLANPVPSNGVSANLGSRYSTDRGNSTYAVANAQDLTPSFYVVATSVTDAGVGSATVATEFSYAGFKKDLLGRGPLGFREVRRQTPAPNGEPLTALAQSVQFHPYTGMLASAKTYRGRLNATSSSQLLGSTASVFCDQTNAAAASASANCPVTALVAKPYVYQSTNTGTDLDGSALPQVVTVNQYTDTGDPKQIQSTSTGTVAGIGQTFTKTVVNTFDPSNTACSGIANCAWVLGRLNRSTVTSGVPNVLASVTTSAGTSTNASATKGTAPLPPLSAAQLMPILQLLLDD